MKSAIFDFHGKTFSVISRPSFRPLIESWKKKIEENREGSREFYGDLLNKVSEYPELLEPIFDPLILERHKSIIGMMMGTIFPVTISDKRDFYAVSIPFTYNIVYSSSLF